MLFKIVRDFSNFCNCCLDQIYFSSFQLHKFCLLFILQCELYHWVDILDKFDEILEKACQSHSSSKWTFACDVAGYEKVKPFSDTLS